MATYYVRPDGSNANAGTGTSTGQAWATITYALTTMVLTTGVNYLYIAPGTYRETPTVVVTPTSTQTLVIQGDPTASIFTNVAAGVVRLTNFSNDAIVPTKGTTFTCNKSFVTIKNIYFSGNGYPSFQNNNPLVLQDNVFTSIANVGGDPACRITATASGIPVSYTIQRCVFTGDNGLLFLAAPFYDVQNVNTTIESSFFMCNTGLNIQGGGTFTAGSGFTINGCTFVCSAFCIYNSASAPSAANPNFVKNSSFYGLASTTYGIALAVCTQTYNYFAVAVPLSGPSASATSTVGVVGYDLGYGKMALQAPVAMFTGHYGSLMATSAQLSTMPALDNLSYPYASGVAGAYSQTSPAGTSFYYPTERNQSMVTIGGGQTSRSLYLYLGATGLTATTTGLQAYYTKEDAAPVSIPLVAQTTTGAWVSGGFAEVSAANQPGVYRLDIPNAAISAGYTQTVVTVRGASGTNGAVVVIQEPPILGSQVRMGPFTVQADGVLTDERLKLFKGSIHSIDFKMVDQYGTGVDGTGTVVTANAYNSAGFLVDSYPCTAKYAEDGRYSFAIDATVTNVVGMYTINISRQIGSEINVFGRMKLEVLSP